MKESLNIRINKETKEKLKTLSLSSGMSITDFVIKLIEDYQKDQESIGMNHTNSKQENKNDKKLNALLVINLLSLNQQYPSLDINKMIFNMDRIIEEEIYEKVSKIEYK